MDIYKEMWKIAGQIENLRNTGYYPNADNLVSGIKHMVSQLDFFYNNLVPNQGGGDYSKTYFNLKNRPIEHQLAYIELNRGYPKEIFDPSLFLHAQRFWS